MPFAVGSVQNSSLQGVSAMPRSAVLHGEPDWKNPEKSRSLHHRGSNGPRAPRVGKLSKAAQLLNVPMTPGAWEEE